MQRSRVGWGVLIGLYLALGIAGAVYLAPTTVIGQDLATYQRAGELLWSGENPYSGQSDLGQENQYRYPPLLAMVIPVLGWPPLWYGLLAVATAATIWLWYRTAGLPGLLVPALLVGAWGQQLLNGNSQAIVVWLLAITPLVGGPRSGWRGSMALGPIALAVATMLKIHPVIGLVWFAGRRDWRAIGVYAAACAVLLLIQLPWFGDFIDYYLNDPAAAETIPGMSLRAIHPAVWIVGFLVVLALAWRYAGTRYGWLLATIAQLVALPRVLLVNLALLLAAPLPPRQRDEGAGTSPPST
ncbi:MAG TPA: glycosyltransferase family 87 protein [Candidatus Limnocylindria bacterium]|nr:glycosyltransferase family 87 protein [Candidatus Limnocylindria bacterium]